MAESAVSAVVGRIGNLVVRESSLLCSVTGEVEFLKEELERLQGFLEDADNKMRSGNASMAVCVRQLRDASYETENIIEAAVYVKLRSRLKKGFMGAISRYARLPRKFVALHKVDVQIRRVRRKISAIENSMFNLNIANLSIDASEDIEDNALIPQNFVDDVVVGFEDECKEIVEKLVDQKNEKLSAVSLVAMGGAGKTTLARKAYNSPRVKEYFNEFAWVTVSQKFKGIDLLNDILKQITGASYESSKATDQIQENEIGKKIHDFLLQRRYLLVLDDVWEADTWEQINRAAKVFPDTNNGSRVLLTTRKKDVAHHIQMPTYVCDLKLMDEEKSWELFKSKALPSYRMYMICNPDKFEEIGRKLARKCAGLPLALAVLGGYLSKNLNLDAWSDLLLGWTSIEEVEVVGHILARSYNDLSNKWRKSCFLYVASFPEDYDITVADLIEVWIAECFIPHTARHTMEETAQRYVTDLAQRNLVQFDFAMASGYMAIQTIRIHDVLRDWCIEEARRDGFLHIIDKTTGQAGASSSDRGSILCNEPTRAPSTPSDSGPLDWK
ncbi:unnamed protein product [Triticum turgidum subsp. durum]|uniref:Uncharacterized protein n=1 Tax=Triticum turgidum subsp. durum TaxID=4567 RepID=A0A9R1Q0E2_TRITD|nr:unnamed protein product [Triticum turgidum subsp. durum]